MSPEILVVRNGDSYCLLHGHLRLSNALSRSNEVIAVASGEGKVKVIKTPGGIFIGSEDQCWPLLRSPESSNKRNVDISARQIVHIARIDKHVEF
jgi:hypothetical protein